MHNRRALLGKLRQLTNLMQRARTQEFAHHDFNMMDGKGRLLSVLHSKDGLTQRELGEELDIRPSSVGELVRKLEAKGLVMRKNSEIDRRVMHVYLTEEGRGVLSSVSSDTEDVQENLFQDISESERDNFILVVDKMIASLQERYASDMQDEPAGECGRGRCRKGRGQVAGHGRGNRGMGRGRGHRQHSEI